jgi:hypothetical protein
MRNWRNSFQLTFVIWATAVAKVQTCLGVMIRKIAAMQWQMNVFNVESDESYTTVTFKAHGAP